LTPGKVLVIERISRIGLLIVSAPYLSCAAV
jgi:hypothetical protein